MFCSSTSNSQQGERCLFCFKGEEENGSFETLKTLCNVSHQHDATADQLGPVFVLRVILGVSVKDLEVFLQTTGHPSTWGIAVCADCKNYITQAVKVHNQMVELRKRLREIKMNCIKCMQSSTESSNLIQKLVCEPVRDKVRLMASSGELDGDGDGCCTKLFDTNDDDWLSLKVKQEQNDEEDADGFEPEEPTFPLEDSFAEDSFNYQDVGKIESESVTKERVSAWNPLRSTRAFSKIEDGKDEAVEEVDPCRRSLRKRTASCRNLSMGYGKSKSKVKDAEFRPLDSDSEESSNTSDEDYDYQEDVVRKKSRPAKTKSSSSNSWDQEKVKCPGCKLVCISDIAMGNHFNSAHSITLDGEYVQCSQCHLAFGDHRNLEIHIELTHAEGLFRCDKCLKGFVNQRAVTKHKGRSDSLRYCEICSAACCDVGAVTQHIKYFHPEVLKLREQEQQDKKQKQKEKSKKTCEQCGKVLSSASGYKLHMEMHRNPKTRKTSIIANYKCSVCEQDFKRKRALKLHQYRQHATELNLTPIPCPTCQKLYPDNSVLSKHIKHVHETPRSMVCEQCGQGFFTESQLARHMLKHGERTIMCSECPSAFWEQRELDDHVLKKHTPYHLRPYWCNICLKRFTSSTKMHTHRKIHEGNSTYECKVCGQTFTQANYLYCHVSKSHGQLLRKKDLEEARLSTPQPNQASSTLVKSMKVDEDADATMAVSCATDSNLTIFDSNSTYD